MSVRKLVSFNHLINKYGINWSNLCSFFAQLYQAILQCHATCLEIRQNSKFCLISILFSIPFAMERNQLVKLLNNVWQDFSQSREPYNSQQIYQFFPDCLPFITVYWALCKTMLLLHVYSIAFNIKQIMKYVT